MVKLGIDLIELTKKATAEEILNYYLWFEEDSDTIDRLRHKLKKRFGVD